MKKHIQNVKLLVLAAVFALSLFMVVCELYISQKEIAGFEKIKDLTSPEHSGEANTSERDIAPLYDANADFYGWLEIIGTNINYPVMHTPDEPQKYLRLSFEGAYSRSGVPFVDARCDAESVNTIIYGHNMQNGTMFSDIDKYASRDFYDNHPNVIFETKSGIAEYAVFAAVRLTVDDKWYNFLTDTGDYDSQIAYIKSKALYDTGITPADQAPLLTLSTCYKNSETERIVVVCAKK